MPVIGSNILAGSSGSQDTDIDLGTYDGKSLIFDAGTSQELSRTPGSDGDMKTWTWSGWIKRTVLGVNVATEQEIFQSHQTGLPQRPHGFGFTTDDKIALFLDQGASVTYLSTDAVYRDPHSWMHVVVVFNTLEDQADNRFIIYVNGELQSTTVTSGATSNIAHDTAYFVNSQNVHYIGRYTYSASRFGNYYLAGVAFVDGEALEPSAFAHTSPQTGAWVIEELFVAEAAASGGTENQDGQYKTHQFLIGDTGDALTFSVGGRVEYLVIGGGGAGGGGGLAGAGGGAGGYCTGFLEVPAGAYTITVGAGGTGGGGLGGSGADSVFHSNTALGGGGGGSGSPSTTGASGGSGGGSLNSVAGGLGSDCGNNGGTGTNTYNAGGGGGASAAGTNGSGAGAGSAATGGNGGAGQASDILISGTDVTRAGGGGGGAYSASPTGGTGGTGGGATAPSSDTNGADGTVNTGGGGSGSTSAGGANDGGDGGSGIVVIRYFSPSSPDFGTNGFYQEYLQTGTGTAGPTTIGADTSGKGNHYTTTNFVAASSAQADKPNDNYATLTPLNNYYQYSEGAKNLTAGNLTALPANQGFVTSSFPTGTTGIWKCEVKIISYTAGTNAYFGIWFEDIIGAVGTGTHAPWDRGRTINQDGGGYMNSNINDTTFSSSGTFTTFTTNDFLTLQWNADNGEFKIFHNTTASAIATLTLDGSASSTDMRGKRLYFGHVNSNPNCGAQWFFNSATWTQGVGDTDAVDLKTSNLAEVEIGQEADDQAKNHFDAVLYNSANIGASGTQNITNVPHQPDLVWIKNRTSGSTSHTLYDAVNGAGKMWKSNDTDALDTNSIYGFLSAFNSNGYTLTGGSTNANYINQSTDSYVSWNWKAGNATLGTGDFTQGSIASTCSRSAEAGISIVSYTGTGSVGTVGHGLSAAPNFIIVKKLVATGAGGAQGGDVYHSGVNQGIDPEDFQLDLNTAGTAYNGNAYWNDTAPTATVFTVESAGSVNETSAPYIAYCFNNVDAFSAYGFFTGNGFSDGSFIETNFKPKYVCIRCSSTGNDWTTYDTARQTFNPDGRYLFLDTADAETASTGVEIDIVSNGFKCRDNQNNINGAGRTYIYMCWAETPFKFATAR